MLNFIIENRFNYVYLNKELIFNNIIFNKNFLKGVNVIILDDYDVIYDSLKQDLMSLINVHYQSISTTYANSLINNEVNRSIISNYSKKIDITNNLTFRRYFKSLIPKHQKFLIDKYNGYENLNKFNIFPASDQNFICFLYSLTLMQNEDETIIPLIVEDFFPMFDYLTLTSACKIMESFIKNNYQFITFAYSDSEFIKSYSKFYNFNYIKVRIS